ncbi:MAG TPA: ATPase, T2SS/T4P/T4SS family [Acidobacteriota bacterium]|nr:ATPase, T2SS/T4P/T4SS family [Acidobacteriota bacterium]
MPAQSVEKKLLGEILVSAGLITPRQLEEALEAQKALGGRLGFHLVKLGFITAGALTAFLEENFGVGMVQERLAERQKAADAIPRHLALYYQIAPLKLDHETLTIAISEIEHPNLMQALSEVTGYQIDPLIYPGSEIRSLLDSSYRLPTERGVELFAFNDNVFTVVDANRKIRALSAAQLKSERDVGEWLRGIIAEAIREKSREILIKPLPEGAAVSFKKDTFFMSDFSLSSKLHDDLTFLLFRLSKMNSVQQQRPQHGRFLVRIHDRKIAMVTSAFPTIYGFRFLLEMFDEKLLQRTFEEVTTPFPELKSRLEEFIAAAKQGMVIITAPDGSGRTSFLYSLLLKCKQQYRQIMTLEDTVRYPIQGMNQTQVPEGEMEGAMENILKQKPDLVAVDALRSVRAVELAFLISSRAPVVSVMSSYDCYVALDWLCRHNLKSPIKAGLLHTIVSPRLIPRACPSCSVVFEPSAEQQAVWNVPAGARMKINQGCDYCRNPENQFHEMIFEYTAADPEMIRWLEENHSSNVLRQTARQNGRKTLFDIALQYAFRSKVDMTSVVKLQAVH